MKILPLAFIKCSVWVIKSFRNMISLNSKPNNMWLLLLSPFVQERKRNNTANKLISKNLRWILNPHLSDSETQALITKFYYLPQSNSRVQVTSPSVVGNTGFRWEKKAWGLCFLCNCNSNNEKKPNYFLSIDSGIGPEPNILYTQITFLVHHNPNQ